MVVKNALMQMGIPYGTVNLGEAEILETPSPEQLDELAIILQKSGLKLMDDKKAMLIEKIKNVVIEQIHYSDEVPRINFSNYLSEKLDYDYNYLANLFSKVTGTTIEHFVISNKVERIKELLLYNELTLSEIADKLNYSSVAHLSHQFKKTTGLTPSFFKQLKSFRKRINLEDL